LPNFERLTEVQKSKRLIFCKFLYLLPFIQARTYVLRQRKRSRAALIKYILTEIISIIIEADEDAHSLIQNVDRYGFSTLWTFYYYCKMF